MTLACKPRTMVHAREVRGQSRGLCRYGGPVSVCVPVCGREGTNAKNMSDFELGVGYLWISAGYQQQVTAWLSSKKR